MVQSKSDVTITTNGKNLLVIVILLRNILLFIQQIHQIIPYGYRDVKNISVNLLEAIYKFS